MAASTALADRHIVSMVLRHLSDMKYKERRQYEPCQPVQFLEFRPTLVPAVLVNKLWADEGTSILWRRYPHLPALKSMSFERRQYYASKVQCIYALGPPPESTETLDYLDGLSWPSLKRVKLEVDVKRYDALFRSMLYDGLDHVELLGYQSGGAKYFAETILPSIFQSCKKLSSISFGPDIVYDDDPIPASALYDHLDASLDITTVEIKSSNIVGKADLFARLSQRPQLQSLTIDLDPGIALLSFFSAPGALLHPFASLKRLSIVCYPEIALSLCSHLHQIEDLELNIARLPTSATQPADTAILNDLLAEMVHCPELRLLKIWLGSIASDFPSASALPQLSGSALAKLAESCPKLQDLSLTAAEPSAIDGTALSSGDFELFCKSVPRLRNLSLKLHPKTTLNMQATSLQTLGRHCPDIEVLRMKVAVQIPGLEVPETVPRIIIDGDEICNEPTNSEDIQPLFPKLTHLAFSRPDTVLAPVFDTSTDTGYSHSMPVVDSNTEEELVRSWAAPLLTHFPRLEILEAWGDFSGHDNESLNYFLPTQEVLASSWEFLSGIEQDLWEDDDELFEGESLGALEDWEKASLMNEYEFEHAHERGYLDTSDIEVGRLTVHDENPAQMIAHGAVVEVDDYYE